MSHIDMTGLYDEFGLRNSLSQRYFPSDFSHTQTFRRALFVEYPICRL